jgi:hypothetical protein
VSRETEKREQGHRARARKHAKKWHKWKNAALPVRAGTTARTALSNLSCADGSHCPIAPLFHCSIALPSSLLTLGKKVAARAGIIPAKRTLIVLPTWVRARHSTILLLFTTATTTTLRLRYAPSTTYLRYLCQFHTALDSPSLPKDAGLLHVANSPSCCCCCLHPTGSFSYTPTLPEPAPAPSSS